MMVERERLEVGCKVILTHLTPPSKNQSHSDTGFVPPTVAEIAKESKTSRATAFRAANVFRAIEKLAETQPEQARLTPLHAQCRNATHVPSL